MPRQTYDEHISHNCGGKCPCEACNDYRATYQEPPQANIVDTHFEMSVNEMELAIMGYLFQVYPEKLIPPAVLLSFRIDGAEFRSSFERVSIITRHTKL